MTDPLRSGSSTTLAHIGNLACYCTMQGAKVTHPDAPVTLLLAHAIELYLKAFLRCAGLALRRSEPLLATTLKVLLMKRLHAGSRLGSKRSTLPRS
jgi:hypothetical protein